MLDLVEEVLGDVLIAAPGCPDMTAERVLGRAARQFCMDTHAWRYTTFPMAVIKGMREVQVDTPAATRVHRVFWATLAGDKLKGVSASSILTSEGRPQGYAMSAGGTLMLDRLPSQNWIEDGVVVHMSLVPERGQTVLADELEPFVDAVAQLAIATLLAMPSVEWRDPRGAGDAMAFYQAQVLEARRFGAQNNQPIHRTVKYGGL